jgi:hypothetical protein
MRHRTRFSFRLRLSLRIVSGAAALAGFNRQTVANRDKRKASEDAAVISIDVQESGQPSL